MKNSSAKTLAICAMTLGIGLQLTGCGSRPLLRSKTAAMQQQRSSTDETKTNPYDTIAVEKYKYGEGLFDLFRTADGELYFSIPRDLLGRHFLIVNRVLEVPPEINDAGINTGINYENILISLSLDDRDKNLYVTNVKPLPRVPEEDAIRGSVLENYRSPFMGKLPVTAFSGDSTRVMVKVTKYFDGRSTLFNHLYQGINIPTGIDSDLSRIVSSHVFEDNLSVVSDLTTSVDEGSGPVYLTVRTASSFVLLPQEPTAGRRLSPRIGYFTVPSSFYSDERNDIISEEVITRWHLSPSDTTAYLAGQLVPPTHPIVFYIDRNTPPKWRTYMKKGIEDWNKAFERAGFRDAIRAEILPDSVDPLDLRFSKINYIASTQENAMGPSVYDPRNGSIIQADIIWWHNVLNILREWMALQTGASRPEAATWDIPDELLGEAMRFVACHETGHSLGLRHNMASSSAYSVRDLRDPDFTSKHGTAPSIMDYARFNYVAQPGDGVTSFGPKIGPYDLFAIEYGYRWYPDQDSERRGLKELLSSHRGPLYRYSEAQDSRQALDPRAQTEDLTDDPIEASTLGIANLKRICKRILPMTASSERHGNYEQAGLMYHALIAQWNTLLFHPMAMVGGMYLETPLRGDHQETYNFVPKERQRRAVQFLLKEAITDTDWLFSEPEVLKYTYPLKNSPSGTLEMSPTLVLSNTQGYLLWDLLDNKRLVRMSENERINGASAYKPIDLMDDIFSTIFAPTLSRRTLTVAERRVQKNLLDTLLESVSAAKVTKDGKTLVSRNAERAGVMRDVNFNGTLSDRTSDAISAKRALMERIYRTISPLTSSGDEATRAHYYDMKLRIENALHK